MNSENPSENPAPDTQESIRDEKGRFKPGFSGNPAGPPKGHRKIADEIKKRVAEPGVAEKIAERIILQALAGAGPEWMKVLLDRNDGQLSQMQISADVIKSIIMRAPEGAEMPKPREGDAEEDVG